MKKKNVLKSAGKGGILAAASFSLLFAASASAGTYDLSYDVYEDGTLKETVTKNNVYLGGLDTIFVDKDGNKAAVKLGNSGDGEVITWLTGVLGPEYTTFSKIDPVTPQWEVSGQSTWTAFELSSAPEYFFIKTGKVDSGFDHFLYQNNDSSLWGFVDSLDWGTDSNIYKVSHVGTATSPVPVPAAAWLLGAGLVGLVGVRRKVRK
ncbi:MAG: VPLPA-CTERM sorting domain-containing protein [bacterium]|nr:VPLPA-CTERM sorting domain-containing protein [bacterium]